MNEIQIAYIPGSLGYSVSTDGVVYSPDGKIRNQYTNGDGYKTASIKMEVNGWQTFGVHRLVALAHLPTDKDPKDVTVNHKDRNVTNNTLSNLEWVSVHLNNIHAAVTATNLVEPTVEYWKDGKAVKLLANLQEAAELLSMDMDLAWEMLRDGRVVNGVELRPYLKKSTKPSELRLSTIKERTSDGRVPAKGISVKDIESGTVLTFDSLAATGKHFAVSPSHVYQALSTPDRPRLLKKRYMVVYEGAEFPTLTPERYREITKSFSRDVAARAPDGAIYIFESTSSFVKLSGLSKKAVYSRLRPGVKSELQDWSFCYLDDVELLNRT